MELQPLEKAILYTLTYTAQFSFPLTKREIWARLIRRLDPDAEILLATPKVTFLDFSHALHHLQETHILSQKNEWLCVSGNETTIALRQRRQKIADAKWQEVTEVVRALQKFPWIEAVYITGSLAMNNVEEPDDIDFMIITSPQRLWLTRLWLTWYAFTHGKRRSWQGEEPRSWCLNVWVDLSQLQIFSADQSLYIAYELVQARCVFDRGFVHARLQQHTPWVKDFLPNIKWGEDGLPPSLRLTFRRLSMFWDLMEGWAYLLQRAYMWPHQTRERVALGYAFFHPRDTENWIWQRWIRTLQTAGLL